MRNDDKPLHNVLEWTVYFKQSSAKYKKSQTHSSNALWLVEHKDAQRGGIIRYREEIRLKHLGTDEYLVVKENENGTMFFALQPEFSENAVFMFHAVDAKENDEVRLDEYFRLQHKNTEAWLHAGKQILKPKSNVNDLETFEGSSTPKFSIVCTTQFNFEDALLPVRVPSSEIDNVNVTNTIFTTLETFLHKVCCCLNFYNHF